MMITSTFPHTQNSHPPSVTVFNELKGQIRFFHFLIK